MPATVYEYSVSTVAGSLADKEQNYYGKVEEARHRRIVQSEVMVSIRK